MTFSIDNPRGLQQPPLGKYVWEKPPGEQGLMWSGSLFQSSGGA